jgi:hypothetical protein
MQNQADNYDFHGILLSKAMKAIKAQSLYEGVGYPFFAPFSSGIKLTE